MVQIRFSNELEFISNLHPNLFRTFWDLFAKSNFNSSEIIDYPS